MKNHFFVLGIIVNNLSLEFAAISPPLRMNLIREVLLGTIFFKLLFRVKPLFINQESFYF
jgi:hypothetical protein